MKSFLFTEYKTHIVLNIISNQQYPWVARLVYDGHFHCGASLISPDYVMTAAHCVRK